MGKSSTISKVAKLLNLNVETIRYYERRGLIDQPEKPLAGYREYPAQTIQRIQFIKRAKELGFTLDEIENLLRLGDTHCEDIQGIAEIKLNTIQSKITDLESLRTVLDNLIIQCRTNPDRTHCPIVESLLPESQDISN
ncbi:MAG: Hg(II)-responsive transcriptional regulator [Gammaproteobacteria bacterium]|nr:Hg(II)-responsive transcriptional regulator [Gammaproteobacteria bacterium]MBL4728639.1 Hg(II)-responsive transcriptional regulator [Gammaproteobacteria bacterium]